MEKNLMDHPERIQFDEHSAFHYGYTCFDCPYINMNDKNSYGEYWCSAWRRYISDPSREADPCSRRPAWPNR